MQVSATLIAAQQAAREARARLAMPQPTQQTGFATQLEKTEGFAPLPLKQVGSALAPGAGPQTAAPANQPSLMGRHIDITV